MSTALVQHGAEGYMARRACLEARRAGLANAYPTTHSRAPTTGAATPTGELVPVSKARLRPSRKKPLHIRVMPRVRNRITCPSSQSPACGR